MLAAAGFVGLLAVPSGAQTPPRVFVLDAGAPALVAIDLASAKRVGDLPLLGTPTWLVQSDDGRFLVALDYGPGEDKGSRGYKAAGRSWATIVDASSLKAIGRVELGFGLESAVPGADGRLTVTSSGYDAKDPKEALPRELVVVDLASARETGRLTLEPGTDLSWRSPDGRSLALLQGQPRTAKYPFPRSRISLVDVAGPSVVATLDASGWDQAERDAERLYLFARGRPDKDPSKNQNGSVEVIALADRRVEKVDLGRAPAGILLRKDGLLAVVSEGAASGPMGELRLVREGKLLATLPVAAHPKWIGEVAGAIGVVGARALTLVDPERLQVSASIALEKDGEAVVGDGDRPFEVVATADQRRAFIHYPAEDKVAVVDLEQKRAIGSTKTGRGGKKLLNTMMSGLTSGMSERIYFYNAGDPPQLLVRPDGRFAYALNLDTNDVTVVNADTAGAELKIGAEGRWLARLSDSMLVVVGRELGLIDTARNAKVGAVSLGELRGFGVAPDGTFAVAVAEKGVAILDGATGQQKALVAGFVKPTRFVFAKGGG